MWDCYFKLHFLKYLIRYSWCQWNKSTSLSSFYVTRSNFILFSLVSGNKSSVNLAKEVKVIPKFFIFSIKRTNFKTIKSQVNSVNTIKVVWLPYWWKAKIDADNFIFFKRLAYWNTDCSTFWFFDLSYQLGSYYCNKRVVHLIRLIVSWFVHLQ